MNRAVVEIYSQLSIDNDKCLIRFRVILPDKVAFKLNDLELVLIHFCNDFRLPVLSEQC
jgi:hypothetical protein